MDFSEIGEEYPMPLNNYNHFARWGENNNNIINRFFHNRNRNNRFNFTNNSTIPFPILHSPHWNQVIIKF